MSRTCHYKSMFSGEKKKFREIDFFFLARCYNRFVSPASENKLHEK